MFKLTLSNPKGINAQAAWDAHFKAALAALTTFTAATLDQALDKSLAEWEKGSAGLAADPAYQAIERYCIRQNDLWKIYSPIEARGLGEEAERKVYNRSKDVLGETPQASQPIDVSFAEGEQLIKNTLTHLQEVAVFYQNLISPPVASALESARASLPDLPPTTGNFFCTVQLPAGMPLDQARKFWQQFQADNTRVRLVLLGAGAPAQAIVDMADPIFAFPGGALKAGRCLWVEIQDVQADVRQWLQQQGSAQPATTSCVFLKANGTVSSVLKTTDIIDETALLDEFLKAS